MCKQAYLIVVFANENQSISVTNVKRVIQHVNIAPVMSHITIAEYTINDLNKKKTYRRLLTRTEELNAA